MAAVRTSRKPPLTAKVVRGLFWVHGFAGADLDEAKPDDHDPPGWLDDARRAVQWCAQMMAWWQERHGSGAARPESDIEPGDEDDGALEAMEQQIYEQEQADDAQNSEYACCECGYINKRKDGHHPGIKCPHTGRCGQCGNDWPCEEHKDQARGQRRRSKKGD